VLSGGARMLKCDYCGKPLALFYFHIGTNCLCYDCGEELMSNIEDFKVKLNKNGGQNER